MSGEAGLLARIYHVILRAYPSEYAETFGDEMYVTFLEGAMEARSQGSLSAFALRELRDTPRVLASAHWRGWIRSWQAGIQRLRAVAAADDLPPPPPDGRESWRQAGWELSAFLITGLLLIPGTYLSPDRLPAGWQSDLTLLGRTIPALTLPFIVIGLVRGLPRWAYPFGGLLLGYYTLTVIQSGLWLFLLFTLLAALLLGLIALLTDPHPTRWPASARQIGRSLTRDATRLSFGLYGALPLAILLAFDDGYLNDHTPYLALSVLAMVIHALTYARSRQPTTQIAALVSGTTLSIWAAWMDQVVFAGGLGNWIAAPYPGAAQLAWILELWVTWTILILAPLLLPALGQTASRRSAA